MRNLHLISGVEVYGFDSLLKPVSSKVEDRATEVPAILGVGDVQFGVPSIGQKVDMGGRYSGWHVLQNQKEPSKTSGEGDEDYVFEIRDGSRVVRQVRINDTFTNGHEEDYSQRVMSLASLGAGGVVFLTDEKELYLFTGTRLEHRHFFDLGYRSTENIRAYSTHKALDDIRSFQAEGKNFVIVNDLDYVHIHNKTDFPADAQGELAPHTYPIREITGKGVASVGYIKDLGKWERTEGSELVKLVGGFQNIVPVELDDKLHMLHGSYGGVDVYRVGQSGEKSRFEKVGELEVPAGNIEVRVMETK